MSEAGESSQELVVGLQLNNTGQVAEYHLDDKKVKESNERASKANKLWNWWRNMWMATRKTQSNDKELKEVKPKAPDEAGRPAKEEMLETDALTLEGWTVQAGNETKPLECDICGKRTLNNLALAGHMQIHLNPHTICAVKSLGKNQD